MKVTVKSYTPLNVIKDAIRTCWDSSEKSDDLGPKDLELIERVGLKYKHSSTLEHCVFNFYIEGISRLCLQELARHRIASYSVKSTRYTLKELKNEAYFLQEYDLETQHCKPQISEIYERASKYIVFNGNNKIDMASVAALDNLITLLNSGFSIDDIKYALPECYKTNVFFSINARSLRNFFELRNSKSAHFEIRSLAKEIYNQLPEEFKFLFSDLFNN